MSATRLDYDVEIFTDGACRGNPGPGGWAALLRFRGHEKMLSGAVEQTADDAEPDDDDESVDEDDDEDDESRESLREY